MSRYGNRIQESSSSTGNGNFTLGGATSGLFRRFTDLFAIDAEQFVYEIVDETNEAWEIGVGKLFDANTLVRLTVLDNHLGTTAKINFGSSSKVVFGTLPAETVPDLGAVNVFSENLTADNLIASDQLRSQIATGTAPIVVSSSTKVTNLNADLLDGMDSTAFAPSAHSHDHGSLSGLADDDHPQYLLIDGSRGLTSDWDVGSHQIRAKTFRSDVTTGTAPFVVASATLVANLNADQLDGLEAAAFALASHNHAASDITSGTLSHERGGIEADISAVAKGDILAGTGAGSMALIPATGKSDGDVLTIQADGSADWETPPTALDHGGLTGLTDDDHIQYLLADGSRGLSADWNAGAHEISTESLDCGSITADVGVTTDASFSSVTAVLADKDVSSSGSNPIVGIDVSAPNADIASAAIESGGRIGIDLNMQIDDADFEGTLTAQMGVRVFTGVNSGSGSISSAFGIYLNCAGPATSNFGIYQIGSAINYFEGAIGIGTSSPDKELEVVGQILADNGTESDPSILIGTTNTGFFSTAANRIQGSIQGVERMRLTGTGLGVNTIAAFALDIDAQTDQYFASFTVDRSTTNAWDATIKMVQVDNAVGAQGGHSYWFNESDDGASRLMGIFKCELAAASTTSTNMAGDFVWLLCETGTSSALEKMRLTSDGNLLIGQQSTAPASMQHGLTLQVGAAPSGDVANQISLYAKDVSSSAELFVRDEGGTETQLSQHATDAPDWMYDDGEQHRQMISRCFDSKAKTMEYINLSRLAEYVDRLTNWLRLRDEMSVIGMFGSTNPPRCRHVETLENHQIRKGEFIQPEGAR
jgi:hypothetical protein